MGETDDEVERARANTDDALEENPAEFYRLAAEEATRVLMVLLRRGIGTDHVTAEEVEAEVESGQAIHVRSTADGGMVVAIVDDPPTARVLTIADTEGDWITTATGRAVKVTGGDGDFVIFVEETAPGSWTEPLRLRADEFLRDHVLAAGVPLLG